MRGRTRSFFEDTSILLIILVVGVIAYQVYINFFETKDIEVPKKQIVKTEEFNTTKTVQTKKNTESNITKIEKNTTKPKKIKPEIKIKKIEKIENNITKKVQQIKESNKTKKENSQKEKIAKLVKNVDIKVLKNFIKETRKKINSVVKYDNNSSKTSLNIRVTILKDGNYEQLKFVSGNKELFEKNKKIISSVFPLTIDDKIVQEFPRYLRVKINN